MSILYQPVPIKKPGKIIKKEGLLVYRDHQGLIHKDSGPAIVRSKGEPRKEYYYKGKLHRDSGPARIWSDGSFEFYQNGVLAGGSPTVKRGVLFKNSDQAKLEWRNAQGDLHRDFAPALLLFDDSEIYYRKGKIHRDSGPAIVRPDDVARKENLPKEVWMENGLKHRTDGPAVVYSCGACSWWYQGKLHREDGPAMIGLDRVEKGGYPIAWMKDGRPSRKSAPAIIDAEGIEYYYDEGILHREDGPAIHYPDSKGDQYYLEGMILTKEQWRRSLGKF